MTHHKHPEQIDLLPYMGTWLALALAVAALAGTASAFFLFALAWATDYREAHPAIIWLLPVAGFAVGWIYLKLGKSVEAGNNLLIDEIGFEGASAFPFGAVLARFFTQYVSLNSFTETVVTSATRGEIMRWAPGSGLCKTL